MDNQYMLNLLRKKAQLQEQQGRSQDQAQIFGQQFQDPQYLIGTPGFSTNINGHQAEMPGQVQVNYGDIIGKGVSTYMQAKAMKDNRQLAEKGDEISQQFMMDTLQNDPQAQKLYMATKAGVKGADAALAQHIAPKKEAMAGLIQGMQNGTMTEEMARELAPTYGINPDVAAAAAKHAAEVVAGQKQAPIDSKFQLQAMRDEAADRRLQTQLASKEEIAAAANLAKPTRETEASKLAARKNMEYQDAYDNADPAIQKYDDLIKLASEAKYLPLNMGLAPDAVNAKGVMLKQAIPDLVLARTGGKLGAGISNADVAFLEKAVTNLSSGNAETVIAQLKQGREHLVNEKAKAAAKLKIDMPSTNANSLPESKYDYTGPKVRQNKEALPSFEDIMKEFE